MSTNTAAENQQKTSVTELYYEIASLKELLIIKFIFNPFFNTMTVHQIAQSPSHFVKLYDSSHGRHVDRASSKSLEEYCIMIRKKEEPFRSENLLQY